MSLEKMDTCLVTNGTHNLGVPGGRVEYVTRFDIFFICPREYMGVACQLLNYGTGTEDLLTEVFVVTTNIVKYLFLDTLKLKLLNRVH